MTTDLSRIYENLTPQQLALLAFNHSQDDDDLERQRILAAVPKETYRLNDWYFTRHSDVLQTVAYVMGIVYWKAQAVYFMRSYSILHQQHAIEASQLDDEASSLAYRDIYQQQQTAAAKLLGTEQAIDDFIDRHGLNRATIQAMAFAGKGLAVSEVWDDVQPCPDNYNLINDLLEGLMTL